MPVWPPVPGGPQDVGTMPIWAALVLFGAPTFLFTALMLYHLRKGVMNRSRWGIYTYALISFVVLFFDATTKDFEPRFFHEITSAIGLHGTQALVAMLVIIGGWSAYRFKQANKLWYGYSEITFGVVSAVLIVSRVNFAAVEFRTLSLAQYGTLVGAAYVVARGLTNASEAREEETKQLVRDKVLEPVSANPTLA
jgi:hypothetical protein